MGLELDQESIGIALVCVGVCEGNVGKLNCGFILLHSIFYILHSIEYGMYWYWEARIFWCQGP